MPSQTLPIVRAGRLSRAATLLVVAGLWPGQSFRDVEAKVAAQPVKDQVVIVGAVLAALLVAAYFAAQFGWIGIALYWLALIVIAR